MARFGQAASPYWTYAGNRTDARSKRHVTLARVRGSTYIVWAERVWEDHMTPTTFQKLAFAALLLLMLGVSLGLLGGV